MLTFASGDVYRGQWKGGLKEGDGVVTFADGRRICGRWVGDKEVSSVPFDAANPAHAAVLRAANEAEARRVGAHRRRTRPAHSMCGAGSGERRRSAGGSCGGARRAAATCNSSGGVHTRQGRLAYAGECGGCRGKGAGLRNCTHGCTPHASVHVCRMVMPVQLCILATDIDNGASSLARSYPSGGSCCCRRPPS